MWPGTWARAQRRKAAHIFTVRGPSACRVSLRLTAFHRRPFKTLFAGDFWRFHRGRTTTTDKQRILPLRPVSRISAPLGHPLTIHWRSDRQISNVGVPGGPRAHAVLRNLRGHSALRRSTRSSVPKDHDTRRSEPIFDGPWHADAPVPMHRPANRRRGRDPTAGPDSR